MTAKAIQTVSKTFTKGCNFKILLSEGTGIVNLSKHATKSILLSGWTFHTKCNDHHFITCSQTH